MSFGPTTSPGSATFELPIEMPPEKSAPPKLAIVVSHAIPHFAPVYHLLHQRGKIAVEVFYLTDAGAKPYFDQQFGKTIAWSIDLLSGYPYQVLRPNLPKGRWRRAYVMALSARLDQASADAALVYGYSKLISLQAWNWVRHRKKPLLYVSDSSPLRERTLLARLAKAVILPFLFGRVSVFLTAGDRNEEYLRNYGVPGTKMRRCPLPVDTVRLASNLNRQLARLQVRQELGISENEIVVLFCGKMTNIKRPGDLVEAIHSLATQGIPVRGLFIGAGPLLDTCIKAAEGTSRLFHFLGFINQDELPRYYCAADILALPSSEDAHPLVATEAALFGLPLVLSDQVGCIGPTDVAQPGRNALVYPCGDIPRFTQSLGRLVKDDTLRKAMGQESSRLSLTQDILVAAMSIEDAVHSVVRSSRK